MNRSPFIRLALWIIPVFAALGPVYWSPILAVSSIEFLKFGLFGALILSLLILKPRKPPAIDLIFVLILSLLYLLNIVITQRVENTEIIVVFCIYIFFLIFNPIRNFDELRKILFRTLLCFAFFPLMVILDYALGGVFFNPFYDYSIPLHLSGFHAARTGWAFSSNIFLSISLIHYFQSKNNFQAGLSIFIGLIITCNIILVGSRGGAIASVIIWAWYFMNLFRLTRNRGILVWAALTATIFLVPFLNLQSLGESFRSLQFLNSNSLGDDVRFDGYRVALDLLSQRPFTGVGEVDLREYGLSYSSIHNVWLRLAVEVGIFIPICVLISVVSIYMRIRRSRFLEIKLMTILMIVTLLASIYEPTSAFGNFFTSINFWFLIATTASLSKANFDTRTYSH